MTRQIPLWIALITLALMPSARADKPLDIPPPSDDAAVWYLTAALHVERSMQSLDAETAELVETPFEEDFDFDRVGPAIDRFQTDLDWARRGATLERCTWPVTLEEHGPYALLPHLSEMRRLSRLLGVSAMVKRERGDLAGSTQDCITIFRLSRHAASDHLLISSLVQYAIEGLAIDLLANQLDRYNRQELEALRKELATIPPKVAMADALKSERVFVHWMNRLYQKEGYDAFIKQYRLLVSYEDLDQGQHKLPSEPDLKRLLKQLDDEYDELDRLAQLPPLEFVKASKVFDEKIKASKNIFVKFLMPSISAARISEFASDSKRAMLDAVIAYRLGGEEAFRAVPDPYDGKPFTREVTDEGLVVASRVKRGGEVLTLTVPRGAAEPIQ